jgi:hypothetical protein
MMKFLKLLFGKSGELTFEEVKEDQLSKAELNCKRDRNLILTNF